MSVQNSFYVNNFVCDLFSKNVKLFLKQIGMKGFSFNFFYEIHATFCKDKARCMNISDICGAIFLSFWKGGKNKNKKYRLRGLDYEYSPANHSTISNFF